MIISLNFSACRHEKRRPEELITKYTNIKNALNHFDNLPTDLKSFTVVYASMFG